DVVRDRQQPIKRCKAKRLVPPGRGCRYILDQEPARDCRSRTFGNLALKLGDHVRDAAEARKSSRDRECPEGSLLDPHLMTPNEMRQGAERLQCGDLIPQEVVEIFDALMQHGGTS